MNPVGKLLLFGLAVSVLISGVMVFACSVRNPSHVAYEGNLVCNSTEEFSSFKDFAVSQDVSVRNLKVTNSTPPITIYYNLNMAVDDYFPYPYDNIDAIIESGKFAFTILAVLFGLVASVFCGLLVAEDFE